MEPPFDKSQLPEWFWQSIESLLPHSDDDYVAPFPMPGGGNNRLFHVSIGRSHFVIKWYFSDPEDNRDRLGAEWSFVNFAWDHGVLDVPEPVACDATRPLAAYKFIHGRRLQPGQIDEGHVQAATRFFQRLNEHRQSPEASQLPTASEACFSVRQHVDCVARRIANLQAVAEALDSASSAKAFINQKLHPAWIRAEVALVSEAARSGISLTDELARQNRVISPSDFGFHNTLLESDGRLRFLDFEYAGWDDPAKTICDFFCQPAIPAPLDLWSLFAEGIAPVCDPSAALRARILFPIYRLKWCCIVLNPLLPTGRTRREFSGQLGAPNTIGTEVECVAKARHILEKPAPN